MRVVRLEKSSAFLLLIVALCVGLVVFVAMALRTDQVEVALKEDSIVKLLILLERDGQPLSIQVLFLYPETRRSCILDVPQDTGLIIKSLGRVDRIGVLYKGRDIKPLKKEIEGLIGVSIQLTMVLSMDDFGQAVDLLDGINIFVPNPIDMVNGGTNVLIPQGSNMLDGAKALSYMDYIDSEDISSDLDQRRQRCVIALLNRIGERQEYVNRTQVAHALRHRIQTNIDPKAMKKFVGMLNKMDKERVMVSKVQGTRRNVERQSLLFPHYDGELLKDIVKQNLNALVSISGSGEGERVFTLEVLNGTPIKGLAKKAAALYEGFGFDVLSVKNAERDDYEQTEIIERVDNATIADNVQSIVHCKKMVKDAASNGTEDKPIDFTIILGKDFNGRYCVP